MSELSSHGPHDIIALIPYLFGFQPTSSIVTLVVREGRLHYASRHDLPEDPQQVPHQAALCRRLAARYRAESVVVVGYGPADRVDPLLDHLRQEYADAGITVTSMLRCQHNRFWWHPNDQTIDGTPYDITTNRMAAHAVLAGRVAFPDHDSFAALLQPIGGADREAMRTATQVARRRADQLLRTVPPRFWYDEGVLQLRQALALSAAHQPLSADARAWLCVLLASRPVRDRALVMVAVHGEDAHLRLWSDLTRHAEPGYVAAPATLLALVAYQNGDGPLAGIAVDRAIADSPHYRLALLLNAVMHHGASPLAVHDSIDGLQRGIDARIARHPEEAVPELPTLPLG
ncbi:DUF4192 domain-containing protein [Nonomuraea sp. KM90]|uniref:DUF4192 domain-containing protein n=1 Tax=Nonomuraea sp. KM90 TaxID=3457428 RepID=UPI003FCD0BC1